MSGAATAIWQHAGSPAVSSSAAPADMGDDAGQPAGGVLDELEKLGSTATAHAARCLSPDDCGLGRGGLGAAAPAPLWAAAVRASAAAAGAAAAEDSGSEASDFEPISLSSSESSEIPEAILEESSDDDRPNRRETAAADAAPPWCIGAFTSASAGAGDAAASARHPAGVVLSAWAAPLAMTMGGPAGGGAGEAAAAAAAAVASGTIAAVARTPVRRARVRGTVCLPTFNREAARASQAAPALPVGRAALRPTTAPPAQAAQELPLPPLPAALSAEWAQRTLAAQRALSMERALAAAARTRAAEEAVMAERSCLQAELARREQEAENRQAVLQALDDDRTALAMSHKQTQAELSRVQVELARVQAELSLRSTEVLALQESQEALLREVSRLPARGTCVVCLDAPASMASVPCGHLALCEACVMQLEQFVCPVCRHPSEYVIHIFTP